MLAARAHPLTRPCPRPAARADGCCLCGPRPDPLGGEGELGGSRRRAAPSAPRRGRRPCWRHSGGNARDLRRQTARTRSPAPPRNAAAGRVGATAPALSACAAAAAASARLGIRPTPRLSACCRALLPSPPLRAWLPAACAWCPRPLPPRWVLQLGAVLWGQQGWRLQACVLVGRGTAHQAALLALRRTVRCRQQPGQARHSMRGLCCTGGASGRGTKQQQQQSSSSVGGCQYWCAALPASSMPAATHRAIAAEPAAGTCHRCAMPEGMAACSTPVVLTQLTVCHAMRGGSAPAHP